MNGQLPQEHKLLIGTYVLHSVITHDRLESSCREGEKRMKEAIELLPTDAHPLVRIQREPPLRHPSQQE